MSFSLSSGCIEAISSGDTPQKPIFQILGLKKISSTVQSSTDRYRLLLSDGQRSHSAMLATQLNKKVTDGELSVRSVIQLNKYICNTIADNKRVIIILEVNLIAGQNQVQDKIGNPVPIGQPAPPAQQNGQAPHNAQTGRGGLMSSRPTTTMPYNAANEMPKMPTTPSGGMSKVFPIASLTPYQNRWTIRARVTNKGNIRHWNNSRGEGCLFSMDLIDDSAEIRATAFNDQCKKYFDMVQVGQVYLISRGTLKTANKQYTSIKNDYEMSFTSETVVELCNDAEASDVPTVQFDFKQIGQLEDIPKDTMVDVIGVCKSFSDVSTIVTRSTNRELSKRELHLVDDSEKVVTLTLWGTDLTRFWIVRTRTFSNCPASWATFHDVQVVCVIYRTREGFVYLRPTHTIHWYDGEGNCKTITSISEQRTGGGGGTNWKNFIEVKKQGLGSGEKPDYFSCKATVIFIKKDNCMYKACPSAECNKKVVENSDGSYRCEKCAKEYPDFKYRMLLVINTVDFGDGQWVTCFQDQAQVILGGNTAEHIGSLKDSNNESEFEAVFQEANFKSYNLRMRIKQETYNDETRLKCSCVEAKPLDYKEHSRRLIQDLKTMISS
ncbi:replication protein A 70 kDa DNA-binding subunit-like [Saccoglossus kowalevskii]|uniref:Replication protein A subunit n=1 Tax=Saccoglossus kowalevskii TaxID=10224 RepID=A0ABM0GIZ5_SACKO|nr:PREDICTED: replication protein A 70 kDa DNA-binding subunit-like [Saccoglossus kowalevskii]